MNTPTSRGELNSRQTKSGTSSKYDSDHLINHDDDDGDDYDNSITMIMMVSKVDAMMIMRMSSAIVKLRKNSLGQDS